MIRIDCIWLALGASDLRGGIDKLLAQVVHGFVLGEQAHHAYVFANRRADRYASPPLANCWGIWPRWTATRPCAGGCANMPHPPSW
jgi:hypothetical protein